MKSLFSIRRLAAGTFLLLGVSGYVAAKSPSDESPTINGNMSTVCLLPLARHHYQTGPSPPPDGLTFFFVVMRKHTAEILAYRETLDFLVNGRSYQRKTKAELGRQFQPRAVIEDADKFFARLPFLAELAPKDPTKAVVISVSIHGAPLKAGAAIEVEFRVGSGKFVEPFTFRAVVPPKAPPQAMQPASDYNALLDDYLRFGGNI